MCGIAGICGFKDDVLIKKFSRQLTHRGPDGEGIYSDSDVSFLNRRLAIIDIKGGDQPFFSADGLVVAIQNGEIYNYKELKTKLKAHGHSFKTQSDTEVIIASYQMWGERCFDYFNGMFAIAIWDRREKKLVLARDHFGIKPLYYAILPSGKLVFSSEITPIFESGLLPKRPNDKSIYRYLKFRIHDAGRETFFAGINRLLPGQMLIVKDGKVELKMYTDLRQNLENMESKSNLTDGDIQEFGLLLEKAVKYRLISDVAVGTSLSGGLDSSTVVALIHKFLSEKSKDAQAIGTVQNTFSAVFPGQNNNEEQYVDTLISSLDKLSAHKVQPTPEEFFADLEDFVATQEEPTISTGPYAQYKLMSIVKKHVTVLLDGQGADEMMAGYVPYYITYLKQLRAQGKYFTFARELATSLDVVVPLVIRKLAEKLGIKKSIPVDSLLNSDYSKKFKEEKFGVIQDNLKMRLLEDIFENSLQSLLRYEDRNSMKYGIEGRVPFLDFELLKYLFTLPDAAIIKSGWNKRILRDSVKGLLPDMIRRRRNKIGFTTPEQAWFLRMKNKIYSIFMSESFIARPYFDQPAVVQAFEQFIEGKNDDTLLFWRVLNIEVWMRVFFDPPSLKLRKGKQKNNELFSPNEGKKLEIEVEDKVYKRYPIRTEIFAKGDDYVKKISESVLNFLKGFKVQDTGFEKKWFIAVSEKIVAISQGRSYFIWDIKTGLWARLLSRYVRRTPYGIGLGSPWTMQLAIDEVGLIRILAATIVSFVTKPFGMKGMFYRVAGGRINAIDGPTEYSLYPSNVSAKLPPKDPEKAAQKIKKAIEGSISSAWKVNFQGVAIVDANDLGQDILGNATTLSDEEVRGTIKDNPMGQSAEQTPVIFVEY